MITRQGPASPAALDRRGPERAGHRGRGHPVRLRGRPHQRRHPHQPPARRRRSLHRGPGHDPAGGLAPPVRRWQPPAYWPPPPCSTGSCSARWSAAAPPCRRSSWSPSRSASGATGPGRPRDCCSARARWSPRASTIRRSGQTGSSSCSPCSPPSSPPGVWSAPGRRDRERAPRVRSAELRRQREETARLAVLADRARLTADLERTLHAQIGGIASTAAAGLGALDTRSCRGPAGAGLDRARRPGRPRATCARSWQPAGAPRRANRSRHWPAVRAPRPGPPPPMPASPSTGHPRTLPAGLELSGYRIVEHLLLALQDAPDAAVDVRLSFCPGCP